MIHHLCQYRHCLFILLLLIITGALSWVESAEGAAQQRARAFLIDVHVLAEALRQGALDEHQTNEEPTPGFPSRDQLLERSRGLSRNAMRLLQAAWGPGLGRPDPQVDRHRGIRQAPPWVPATVHDFSLPSIDGLSWRLHRLDNDGLLQLAHQVFRQPYHPALAPRWGTFQPPHRLLRTMNKSGLWLLEAQDEEHQRLAATIVQQAELLVAAHHDEEALLLEVRLPDGRAAVGAEVAVLATLEGRLRQWQAFCDGQGFARIPLGSGHVHSAVSWQALIRYQQRMAARSGIHRQPSAPGDYWQVHLASTRPVIAPGGTADLSGIVRVWRDGKLQPHADRGATLVLRPHRSAKRPAPEIRVPVTTDAFGTFSASVPIPDHADWGDWNVRLLRQGRLVGQAQRLFSVNELIQPGLHLLMSRTATPLDQDPADIYLQVHAATLAGEPLVGQAIILGVGRWRSTRAIAQGTTDHRGNLSVIIPRRSLSRYGRRVTIQAWIDDGGRLHTDELQVDLEHHAQRPIVRVQTPQQTYALGDAIPITISLRDPLDNPVAGQVELQVNRINPERNLSTTQVGVGPEGTAQVVIWPTIAERLSLGVVGPGPSQRTSQSVTVVDQPARLYLWTDAKTAEPGQRLRVRMAGPPGWATLSMESGPRREWHGIDLRHGPASLDVDLGPNDDRGLRFHLSQLLPAAENADEGSPERLLERTLTLPPNDQLRSLALDLEAPHQAKPGETVTLKLQLRDWSGTGIAGSIALAMVDEAHFYPYDDQARPLDERFTLPTRQFRMHTARTFAGEPLHDQLQRFLGVTWEGRPGLRTCGGFSESAAQRAIQEPAPIERRNRQPQTLWLPHLTTDEQGRAQAEVTLPDNLGAWRITARAASRDHRIAELRRQLTVSRAQTLRYARMSNFQAGHPSTLRVWAHNHADAPVAATISLSWDLQGVADGDAEHPERSLQRSVVIPAGAQRAVDLSATLPAGQIRLRSRIEVDGVLVDAVSKEYRVWPGYLRERWVFAQDGETSLSVELSAEEAAHLIGIRVGAHPDVNAILNELLPSSPMLRPSMHNRNPSLAVSLLLTAGTVQRIIGDEYLCKHWPRWREFHRQSLDMLHAQQRRGDAQGWGLWFRSKPRMWINALVYLALAETTESKQPGHSLPTGLIPKPEEQEAIRAAFAALADPLVAAHLRGEPAPVDPDAADHLAEALAQLEQQLGSGIQDLGALSVLAQALVRLQVLEAEDLQALVALAEQGPALMRLLLAEALDYAGDNLGAQALLASAALHNDPFAAPPGSWLAHPQRSQALALRALRRLRPEDPLVSTWSRQLQASLLRTIHQQDQVTSAVSLLALVDDLETLASQDQPEPQAWRLLRDGELFDEDTHQLGHQGLDLYLCSQIGLPQRNLTLEGLRGTWANVSWWSPHPAPERADGLRLQRQLWVLEYDELGLPSRQPYDPAIPLRQGQQVESQLILETDYPLEAVRIHDPSVQGLHPISQQHGAHDGIYTHRRITNAGATFTFAILPAGRTVLRHRRQVALPGDTVWRPAEARLYYHPYQLARTRTHSISMSDEPPAPIKDGPVVLNTERQEALAQALISRLEAALNSDDPDQAGEEQMLFTLTSLLHLGRTRALLRWLAAGSHEQLPDTVILNDVYAISTMINAWTGRNAPPQDRWTVFLRLPISQDRLLQSLPRLHHHSQLPDDPTALIKDYQAAIASLPQDQGMHGARVLGDALQGRLMANTWPIKTLEWALNYDLGEDRLLRLGLVESVSRLSYHWNRSSPRHRGLELDDVIETLHDILKHLVEDQSLAQRAGGRLNDMLRPLANSPEGDTFVPLLLRGHAQATTTQQNIWNRAWLSLSPQAEAVLAAWPEINDASTQRLAAPHLQGLSAEAILPLIEQLDQVAEDTGHTPDEQLRLKLLRVLPDEGLSADSLIAILEHTTLPESRHFIKSRLAARMGSQPELEQMLAQGAPLNSVAALALARRGSVQALTALPQLSNPSTVQEVLSVASRHLDHPLKWAEIERCLRLLITDGQSLSPLVPGLAARQDSLDPLTLWQLALATEQMDQRWPLLELCALQVPVLEPQLRAANSAPERFLAQVLLAVAGLDPLGPNDQANLLVAVQPPLGWQLDPSHNLILQALAARVDAQQALKLLRRLHRRSLSDDAEAALVATIMDDNEAAQDFLQINWRHSMGRNPHRHLGPWPDSRDPAWQAQVAQKWFEAGGHHHHCDVPASFVALAPDLWQQWDQPGVPLAPLLGLLHSAHDAVAPLARRSLNPWLRAMTQADPQPIPDISSTDMDALSRLALDDPNHQRRQAAARQALLLGHTIVWRHQDGQTHPFDPWQDPWLSPSAVYRWHAAHGQQEE